MATKKKYPSQLADRLILRLPDGMHTQIHAAAMANGRSMNGEVIARLQASFHSTGDADVDLTGRVEERLNEARLETTKAERRTAEFQVQYLEDRLADAKNRNALGAEIAALEKRLDDARSDLHALLLRVRQLLEEGIAIDRRYQDRVRPIALKSREIAEEQFRPELSAAQEREARRRALLSELGLTEEQARSLLREVKAKEVAREAQALRELAQGPIVGGGKRSGKQSKPAKKSPQK